MSWYHLVIRDDDDWLKTRVVIPKLMEEYQAALIAAGAPRAARVFVDKNTFGYRIYYFPPEATAITEDILREFRATPCTEEPDVTNLQETCL